MNTMVPVSVPEPVVTLVGGIVRREYKIPAGMMLLAHTHGYDHLSILISGVARLARGNDVCELTGPAMVVIEKNKQHSLYAIEECVWDCLHGFEEAAQEVGNPSLLGLEG